MSKTNQTKTRRNTHTLRARLPFPHGSAARSVPRCAREARGASRRPLKESRSPPSAAPLSPDAAGPPHSAPPAPGAVRYPPARSVTSWQTDAVARARGGHARAASPPLPPHPPQPRLPLPPCFPRGRYRVAVRAQPLAGRVPPQRLPRAPCAAREGRRAGAVPRSPPAPADGRSSGERWEATASSSRRIRSGESEPSGETFTFSLFSRRSPPCSGRRRPRDRSRGSARRPSREAMREAGRS